MEIEALDPRDIEIQEASIEFKELKRLEKKMKRVEKEKIRLLAKEYGSEGKLILESGKRALDLKEVESRFDFQARERERALTRIYGRLNSKIKT